MAKTKTKKAAPVEEVDDDDDVELEDLDEDVDEDEAPAKKGGSQQEVTFGIRDLAALIKEKTGKEYTPRELRTLIRKMARDGSGRIDREITAGNRTRYDWPDGASDPEVKAILKAVKGGEIEAGKKEALDKLKEQKAKKNAQKAKAEGTSKKKGKKAAKVEEPEDVDDLEDLEDEDDDE